MSTCAQRSSMDACEALDSFGCALFVAGVVLVFVGTAQHSQTNHREAAVLAGQQRLEKRDQAFIDLHFGIAMSYTPSATVGIVGVTVATNFVTTRQYDIALSMAFLGVVYIFWIHRVAQWAGRSPRTRRFALGRYKLIAILVGWTAKFVLHFADVAVIRVDALRQMPNHALLCSLGALHERLVIFFQSVVPFSDEDSGIPLRRLNYTLFTTGGLILGEGIGGIIVEAQRDSFLCGPREQTRTIIATPPTALLPFEARQFRSAMNMCKVFCICSAGLAACIGTYFWDVRVPAAIAGVCLLGGAGISAYCEEYSLHSSASREYARVLLSRASVILVIFARGTSWLLDRVGARPFPVGNSAAIAWIDAGLHFFFAFCMRSVPLQTKYRAIFGAATTIANALLPHSNNVIGQPGFTVMVAAAVLLGEVAGSIAVHIVHMAHLGQEVEAKRHRKAELESKARAEEAEARAERARAEAEANRVTAAENKVRADAERGINDFLAHEVRNPLSVAVGGLRFVEEILADCDVPLAAKHDIAMVRTSLAYVDELMTSLLDLNKFLAGKIDLRPERCSLLESVLRPVEAMLAPRRKVRAALTVATTQQLWVEADTLRLKQVVVNLAKNALKFVRSGFVHLGAERVDANTVRIWCADSGPGIPADKATGLFDQYTQLHSHDQGTGIGLALCKQIVQQMGGTIGIDSAYHSGSSEHGPGACFVAVLPLPEAAESSSNMLPYGEAVPLVRLRGPYRALVVDDDMAVRLMTRRTLQAAGLMRVDEAEHGEACLEMVKKCEYDLIVMDHYMAASGGTLTGGQTIAELRAKGSTALIVGSSGNDLEEEHLAAGAHIFWRKPLPSPALIAEDLRGRLPLPHGPWRVLLADDDVLILAMMLRTLQVVLPNAVIDEVSSGRDALNAIEADGAAYDLILLDEHMGDEVKGTDVAKAAREAGSEAMVIGISGAAMATEHRAAGCDLSWPKSIDDAAIRSDLLRLCVRDGGAPEKEATEDEVDVQQLPFGLERMRDFFGAETYAQLVDTFVEQFSTEGPLVQAHVDNKAWAKAKKLSHKMRGSLCAMGLECAGDVVALHEALQRQVLEGGGAEEEVRGRCAVANSKIGAVIDFLKEHTRV